MIPFTVDWINEFPKIINDNGCWIPKREGTRTGHVQIMVDGIRYYLHRIVLCVYYNINYDNYDIETRHNKDCDNSCFNHEHLKPGSHTDNMRDKIEHGKGRESRTHCPKCGNPYTYRRQRAGIRRGEIIKLCKHCTNLSNKLSKRKNRIS